MFADLLKSFFRKTYRARSENEKMRCSIVYTVYLTDSAAIPTKGFSLGEIFVGFVNFAKHNCRFSAKKQCC